MDWLVQLAQGFIGIFQAGAEWWWAVFVGIVPLVVVLMTAFNAVIAWIGHERIENFGKFASQEGLIYLPFRYLLLPVVSVFVLTNPMAYTMGRFLPEKYKPAFYDAAVSFVHPPLGILPHVNPGELFVWAGIATGVATGYGDTAVTDLAVRYLLVGLVVILIRGIVTERLTAMMWKKASA
ncbi:MAG TPA: PTS glucitol/sorbitol transporter subunit IIC [Anaerolineales bacterium]|nr:PTS glucitol/sorbitol transporter subunit IIC [Anaerolineales bacterium]